MTSVDPLLLVLLVLVVVAVLAAIVAAWTGLRVRAAIEEMSHDSGRLDALLRDEAAQSRRENAELSGRQRSELATTLGQFSQTLATHNDVLGRQFNAQLESFARQLEALGKRVDERQQAMLADAGSGREQQALTLHRFGETMTQQLGALGEANAQRMQELRETVEARLAAIQGDNTVKLEEMRRTVDEKLHATLETRLGESFKLVSDRLEQVQHGLGEMQALATGVGDLKRVLTNVKTRGGWGEVQLETLLEQLLTPDQFSRGVTTRPGTGERVDFAIRLPGRIEDGTPVWLPLDAKFPHEAYERIVEASEKGDLPAIEAAGKVLEQAIKAQAKSIHDKYVEPPHTTDFALMYLPTEGLYAEVLRRPGLSDLLQREHRVTLAGPTTLTALLNSLQMGFKTLAIEKRSSEVWRVLGAVKTEFGKFSAVLDNVKNKLDAASRQIDETGVRSRAIEKKLRSVEAISSDDMRTTSSTSTLALPLDDEAG